MVPYFERSLSKLSENHYKVIEIGSTEFNLQLKKSPNHSLERAGVQHSKFTMHYGTHNYHHTLTQHTPSHLSDGV